MMLLNVRTTQGAFSPKRNTSTTCTQTIMTTRSSRMPRHAAVLFLCLSVLSLSIPCRARRRWTGSADIMLNDVCTSSSSASFAFASAFAFAFAPHRLQQKQHYRYNKQSVPFRIDTLTQTTITTIDPTPQNQFMLHSLAAVRRPTTMAQTSSSLFLLRNKNHNNFGFHDDKQNHASTRMTLELMGSGDENGDYGTFGSDADEMSGNIALINDADEDSNNNSMQTVETNKEQENKQQSTGDEIFSIAIPALAGLAIDPLMTLADTVFVGRTSTNADALAGMGSAAALLTFSFYLFNFLCTVTTPLVSQRRAAGDDNGAVEVGGQALSLAIILGASLTGVLTAFSQPLLDVMGTGSTGINANGYALSFLGIRAFAAPAVFLISASTGILRGYLDTKTTFVILLGANVVNFLLDVALIVGLDMGPAGAAIATTTAEWICAILLLFIVAGKFPSVDGKLGSNQHAAQIVTENISLSTPLVEGGNNSDDKESPSFGKRGLQQEMVVITPTINLPTWDAIKPLVAASSSVFIRSFMLQSSLAGAAAMAARSGGMDSSETASASIAAHQIALQLWLLCSFVCDALAAASQALVADRLGREDPDGVRDVCKTILMYSLGLGIFLATSLGLGDFSGFLLNLFTQDALTKEILQQLLVILIIAQPLNAYVFAADGILQGASLFSYEAKSMVFSVLFGISSFYSLQFFGGYNEYSANTLLNVWYSLVILQLARGGTSFWKLRERGGILDIFS